MKVLDLGTAKLAEWTLSTTGKTWGTVSYMAPEQLLGQPVTPRTGLYALGLVAYELIARHSDASRKVWLW